MVKLNDLQKHELIDWSEEVENILRILSEKAQIWRILHVQNHNIFKRKYYCLIIPVTILSSITGAANLALGSISNGNETIVNLVIGAIGIIISVISTLNNIFSFQKRKDEHYRASKDWYRVQRMIDIELSLQKSKRNNVNTFFHLVLQEIERIHEFHPNIRDDVIRKFMKKYKNKKLNIDIPEILSIKKTLIFNNVVSNNQLNILDNSSLNVERSTPQLPSRNFVENNSADESRRATIHTETKNQIVSTQKINENNNENKDNQNFLENVNQQNIVKNSNNEINKINKINDNNNLIDISNNSNNSSSNNTVSKSSYDNLSQSVIIDINDISNEPSKTYI